jgi:hypothetical protein
MYTNLICNLNWLGLPCETNDYLDRQKYDCFLWKPKFKCCIYKIQPLIATQSQNLVCHLSIVLHNIVSRFTPSNQRVYFFQVPRLQFWTRFCCLYFKSHLSHPRLFSPKYLLITANYWISHYAFSACLFYFLFLRIEYLLSPLFSNILNLRFSLLN